MAPNQEILSSILEILLVQPTPDSILKPIFDSLPISLPFSPRLVKSLLLRLLRQRPFSDQTLTSLELMEQLDRNHFSRSPSKSLQLAYSAVAVDLTVRFLRNDGGGEGELGDFFYAVNMIWNIRVGDLEEGEGKGLVSERLREERRLMEKAVGDVEVRGVLRRRDTGGEAAEAVKGYVREAVKEMGPQVIVTAALEEVRRWGDGKEPGGRDKARMSVELNESSNRGESLANEFSHLSMPKIIQEKNQVKPGDKKDYDMAEKPSSVDAGAFILAAGRNEAAIGGDCSTSICSLSPLPNVIQENQLKQRDEMDLGMVKEPLPEILQAGAGISTAGTGDVSNHERMEQNLSLMDCDQAPSVDKGAELICARDGSSGMHDQVHDTSLEPISFNQNLSGLNNGQENQNVVNGNATAPSIDKGMVIHSTEGKITLIGKKRERVDDAGLQPGFVDQYPTEWENGEANQNAVTGNAMACSLDKGAVALNTVGKSTVIGKKREGVHDTGLQPSLMAQSPAEREKGEENHNGVSGDARVALQDKGKAAIHTNGTSTLTGGTKESHALRKASIMDRNPTAHTQKWHDDCAESPLGTSPNPSEKVQIPRQKKTGVPDTKIPWNREFAGRRKKKWWSTEEEDTLRKAVEKFGVGNWAPIKNSYPAIFEDRSSGDLKDKWRNMNK